MNRSTAAFLTFALSGLAGLAGCAPSRPAGMVSRQELVAEYNANAGAIPRLWARAKIELRVTDDRGRTFRWGSVSPLTSPNGLLLLEKTDDLQAPADFVLIGREPGAIELFRLGAGAMKLPEGKIDDWPGVYYLWYRFGDLGQAWWGLSSLAGSEGIKAIPIDPLQLLGVLSITQLPDDFTQIPTVVLTMSEDPYAYVVTYLDRQPSTGRIVFRREVLFRWSDTEPRRPFQVNLFDQAGRRVMTAELRAYKPISDAQVQPGAQLPTMPTDIRITWPDRSSSLRLTLSEMSTRRQWDRSATWFDPPPGLPSESVDAQSAGGVH